MTQTLRHLLGAIAIAAFALFATPASATNAPNPFESISPQRVQGTIVDVAVGNPNFSTLVTALTAANLVTTLQGRGPFTVFAPTNDAFKKLPPALLQFFLSNPTELSRVLLYHVAPGARDLQFNFIPVPLKTVQGQDAYAYVRFDRAAGTFRIVVNNSVVLARPIRADNGIIYVVDSVLLPQYR
jgi:transforming growth factor-beta-induced protein